MLNTPILFLIFNRSDTTQKVFDAIRRVKPRQLFVAADGPRIGKEGEKEKCEETRNIIKQVDWDCEVKTLFRNENLGCGKAVSGAITWFFENVEEGIILEDDCLPDPSFFQYCEELLEKYRFEDQVMHIGGNNFLFNKIKIDDDYYFSRIPHIWGWATWRRSWLKYDFNILDWTAVKTSKDFNNLFDKYIIKGWINIFNKIYNHEIDTWDYQWTYCILKNNGLCINPKVNLVSNIGFSELATHTKIKSKFDSMPSFNIDLKKYPSEIKYNNLADNYILRHNFGFSSLKYILKIVVNLIKKYI